MITVGGWRALPNRNGGFDIHAPGSYDTFRGWAETEDVAKKWLDEASGEAYKRLPPVRQDELRIVQGEKTPLARFPFRRNDYYQHTFYYLGDTCLGSVQVKREHGRTETLTLPFGQNCCCRGADLRWLCQQNGLRLVS